jgi:hypothetical protein
MTSFSRVKSQTLLPKSKDSCFTLRMSPLKSLPRDRLSWMKRSYFQSALPGKSRTLLSIRPWLLPSISLKFNVHLSSYNPTRKQSEHSVPSNLLCSPALQPLYTLTGKHQPLFGIAAGRPFFSSLFFSYFFILSPYSTFYFWKWQCFITVFLLRLRAIKPATGS